MAHDLTSIDLVKRQLGIITNTNGTLADNTDDDDILQDYVTEASQMFMTETRRQFYAQGGATLTYDQVAPDIIGRKLYFSRDLLAVDRVYNGDGSVIPPTDYRLLPLNATPYYGLELYLNASTQWVQGDRGYQNVATVNGTTGFCATGAQPDDVTLAVTKLAAFLYQVRDSSGEIVRFADGSTQIPQNAPALVLRTIQRYARLQVYA